MEMKDDKRDLQRNELSGENKTAGQRSREKPRSEKGIEG